MEYQIRKDLEKCISLARIEVSEEERERLLKDILRIVEYFKVIGELDTENVKPLYHVLELRNRLRRDEPRECLTQEMALRNTTRNRKGYFITPKAF